MTEKLPPPPQWLIKAIAEKQQQRTTLPQSARAEARRMLNLPARKPRTGGAK